MAAFAATVPPPVIGQPRPALALIACVLGQRKRPPAIAATEASTRNVVPGRDGHVQPAGASATATQLTPFTESRCRLPARPAWRDRCDCPAAPRLVLSKRRCRSWSPPYRLYCRTFVIDCSPSRGGRPVAGHSQVWIFWLDKLWALLDPNSNFWNTIASSGLFLPSNTVRPFWVYSAAWQLRMLAGDVLGEAAVAGSVARWQWRRLALGRARRHCRGRPG